MLPPAPAAARIVKARAKLAETALDPFIVIVAGFDAPLRAPDQPANAKPAAGTAATVTTVPAGYLPPGGSKTTAPSPLAVTASVHASDVTSHEYSLPAP